MSKALKGLIRDELAQHFDGTDGGLFISYAGLDSEAMYALRRGLHDEGVRMRVVPNRITMKVLRDLEVSGVDASEGLRGDTAVIMGETPIHAARAIRSRVREGLKVTVRGGLLEGELLDAEQAGRMADLPTREELLAQIAYCFQASAQRIAGCFQQTYKQIAGCFVSYSDELEKGGDAA
jgi:large subunit ribosomal protein L10